MKLQQFSVTDLGPMRGHHAFDAARLTELQRSKPHGIGLQTLLGVVLALMANYDPHEQCYLPNRSNSEQASPDYRLLNFVQRWVAPGEAAVFELLFELDDEELNELRKELNIRYYPENLYSIRDLESQYLVELRCGNAADPVFQVFKLARGQRRSVPQFWMDVFEFIVAATPDAVISG